MMGTPHRVPFPTIAGGCQLIMLHLAKDLACPLEIIVETVEP